MILLSILLVSTHVPAWFTALLLGAGVAGIYVAARWTTW